MNGYNKIISVNGFMGMGCKILAGLEKFFQCRVEGKEHNHKLVITQHWIGYDGEKSFVYLLTSNVFKDTVNEYVKYSEMDGFAITLDIFIGDKEYLGKGKDLLTRI